MRYVLDNNSKMDGEINIKYTDGFDFIPKITSDILIDKITLFDSELIANCIHHKFMNRYKKLLAIIIKILQSDDASDTDYEIALNEIERQKEIVLTKYHHFLKLAKEKDYLKKLEYLEIELKNKYLYRMTNEEEQSISR